MLIIVGINQCLSVLTNFALQNYTKKMTHARAHVIFCDFLLKNLFT